MGCYFGEIGLWKRPCIFGVCYACITRARLLCCIDQQRPKQRKNDKFEEEKVKSDVRTRLESTNLPLKPCIFDQSKQHFDSLHEIVYQIVSTSSMQIFIYGNKIVRRPVKKGFRWLESRSSQRKILRPGKKCAIFSPDLILSANYLVKD